MKLCNIIKISLKLFSNNKKQKIFIICLFSLINFLVCSVLIFGINIYSSSKSTNINYYQNNNISIDYNKGLSFVSSNEISNIYDLINDYEIDVTAVYSKYDSINVIDYELSKFNVIEGKGSKNYSGQNYIYLPSSLASEYKINDTYSNSIGEFYVAGFINDFTEEIVDMRYLYTKSYQLKYVTVEVNSDSTDYNKCIEFYDELAKLQEKYGSSDNILPTRELENLKKSKMLFSMILTCIIVFSIILFAFSMGLISNSIMISYEGNYHSYSILKLLGARNSDVWKVAFVDVFILATISSIVSMGIYCAFVPLMNTIVHGILDTICSVAFDGYSNYIYLDISFHLYVFAVEFIFVVIFMMLLIKKKMIRGTNMSLAEMARSKPNE